MSEIILFNKPFGVLSQFSSGGGRAALIDYIDAPGFYPAGRLDADSEGLLVLVNDGALQAKISSPRHKLEKTYLVQVEGIPDAIALSRLAVGIDLGEYITRPARVRLVAEPGWLWPRNPPIRVRQKIPTSWIELVIAEGKNRQVRRMTAAVGYPTLRLIRSAIGNWVIQGLEVGKWHRQQADIL